MICSSVPLRELSCLAREIIMLACYNFNCPRSVDMKASEMVLISLKLLNFCPNKNIKLVSRYV